MHTSSRAIASARSALCAVLSTAGPEGGSLARRTWNLTEAGTEANMRKGVLFSVKKDSRGRRVSVDLNCVHKSWRLEVKVIRARSFYCSSKRFHRQSDRRWVVVGKLGQQRAIAVASSVPKPAASARTASETRSGHRAPTVHRDRCSASDCWIRTRICSSVEDCEEYLIRRAEIRS